MKKNLLVTISVIAFFVITFSESCKPPRFTDAVSYNDSIIDRIDMNTDVLSNLDDDMINDDGSHVMSAMQAAKDTLTKTLNYIKGMGAFKDYDDFRKAAETFVQNDLNRITTGYSDLAQMIVKYGADFPDEEVDGFNDKLKKLDDASIDDMNVFNKAQDLFADKFDFSVMHMPDLDSASGDGGSH